MNWTHQSILLLILVLLLVVLDAVVTRASRLCRNMAFGIICGGVLGFAGAAGLLGYIETRGPGVLNWVPQPIVFGRLFDLVALTLQYAPLVGALGGVICAWWVTRQRGRRGPENS